MKTADDNNAGFLPLTNKIQNMMCHVLDFVRLGFAVELGDVGSPDV